MNKHNTANPIKWVLSTYLLCYAFRIVEYLFLRTDRTVIGEAFIHKALGILVLALVLRHLHCRWEEIGFVKSAAVRHTLWGLLLGIVPFAIAYTAEMLLQWQRGNAPQLRFYISSYSISGNTVMETSLLFFALCVAGNILNVIMEEGLFRGLYLKLLERNTYFPMAVLCSCLLFGLWHIAAPLRELVDGTMSLGSFGMAALMQVLLTGIMAVLLCLLVKGTGTLWAAMAVHFVNNFIVNILHVVTLTGADELQVIRISIAQTLTFLVVLGIYVKNKSHRQRTFRWVV